MAQRYTTFIPGYVFNIFEPLYMRIGPYIYTIIACRPVNLFCANFFEQSTQYRIEPKDPLGQYFYELMRHISISLFASHKICTAEIFSSTFG